MGNGHLPSSWIIRRHALKIYFARRDLAETALGFAAVDGLHLFAKLLAVARDPMTNPLPRD